jgi:splicing factor U2AF subunit
LDGIQFQDRVLKLKRPSDYSAPANTNSATPPSIFPQNLEVLNRSQHASYTNKYSGANYQGTVVNGVSNLVPDGPNKVFCGGLPATLSEPEVKELVTAFGQLQSFHLVFDRDTKVSRGYAFFTYMDPNVTDIACAALNGVKIGEKVLTVRRAAMKSEMHQQQQQQQQLTGNYDQNTATSTNVNDIHAQATNILVLTNMVTAEELQDDTEYNEILAEIKEELEKYGNVLSMQIPRPLYGNTAGVGKVFIQFSSINEAVAARKQVEGRLFDNRVVAAEYITLDQYQQLQF